MTDWAAWAERERTRGSDLRVQAIRCTSCHRLRQHPQQGVAASLLCACGGAHFVRTFPYDDEEQIALKLYAREIEERNLYGKIAQELTVAWEHDRHK